MPTSPRAQRAPIVRAVSLVLTLAASALALGACRDESRPDVDPPDIGRDGGDGAADVVVPPPKVEAHASKNPQPKVNECARAAFPATGGGTCAITKAGTPAGRVVLQGTVLGPGETFRRGEVMIDAGRVTCVGCDCSAQAGYADASVVTCPDGVISPGLVNPHEHLTYANNTPVGHGQTRYLNRADWQGRRGGPRLAYDSGANTQHQAFSELRYILSGTTTIAGGGGAKGLARNADDGAENLEGMPIQIADSDVFPLPGDLRKSGPRWHGLGLATEAATRVLADAWLRYSLSRVHAVVDSPNLSSRRVLERLGFQLQGPVSVYGSADMMLYTMSAPPGAA